MNKEFRFFDSRQKYLLFVTTTNEKNILAERITSLVKSIIPKKPALKIFDAGLGENPMPPPKCMVEAVKKYAHLKHYTDTDGIPELQNILGPNLVIGNGLKPLLFLVQLAFSKLYPDNTIIHLKPHWVSYKEQTQIKQCNIVGRIFLPSPLINKNKDRKQQYNNK